MTRIRNIIISAFTLSSFLACSPPLIDNVNPSTSSTPSGSNISSSSSPISSTPSPTPFPIIPVGEYKYDIPLSISSFAECSPNDKAKNLYEIKSDGSLVYTVTESGRELTREKKLTTSELSALRSVLEETNIAKLAEADQTVKAGTPQTTDCRNIETININVNFKEKSFDRNGRQFIHSKEYFDAISQIKSKVEDLKSDTTGQKYTYSLPIKISSMSECSPDSERPLYELSQDRTFTYIISENDLTQLSSRKLTESEFNSVKDLLKTTDLATLAESDSKVVSGSPQTRECRTIENTQVFVNGTYKVFDKNSRSNIHSQAYMEALAKITAIFRELSLK